MLDEQCNRDQSGAPVAHLIRHQSEDEDRAWTRLYLAVLQPPAAEEVVRQLDTDALARRSHLALYIRARTTLREQKIADARNRRIGAFVRSALTIVIVSPLRMLAGACNAARDLAVAATPPLRSERTSARPRPSTNDAGFTSWIDMLSKDVEATESTRSSSSAARKVA